MYTQHMYQMENMLVHACTFWYHAWNLGKEPGLIPTATGSLQNH